MKHITPFFILTEMYMSEKYRKSCGFIHRALVFFTLWGMHHRESWVKGVPFKKLFIYGKVE